jgi:hypothetical protein
MTTDSFRLKWLDRNRKIGPRVEAIISNPKAFSDGHKRHLLKYCMHFMLLRLLQLLWVFTVLIAPLRVLGPLLLLLLPLLHLSRLNLQRLPHLIVRLLLTLRSPPARLLPSLHRPLLVLRGISRLAPHLL